MRLQDRITDGEHQPIGSGVQDQPHLVGERAAATGAVGGELSLVQFDEVFGLTSCAVNRLVDMLGRSGRSGCRGPFERRIEPQPIEVVGVFITAGDGEDAGAEYRAADE
jgi:hypothetical protein